MSQSKSQHSAADSGHRSGAVARMLGMPVATLRVWERRYGVTQASLSASGQRLYSACDVRRLATLKQLTDLGHAIGTLARLDMDALQHVVSTHADAVATAGHAKESLHDTASRTGPLRLAVIGSDLFARLQRPELLLRVSRPIRVLGPFSDLAHASADSHDQSVDAFVVHQPRLHMDWLDSLQAAAPSLSAKPKAVLYRFAAESTCAAFADAGFALLREPQNDTVLGQWLQALSKEIVAIVPATIRRGAPSATVPPRRWDDAALSMFSALSPTVACECPRHVAELLMQLSHFESYSAECRNRSTADSELHAYLQQVAATSRIDFERALQHVALHEGFILPRHATPSHPES